MMQEQCVCQDEMCTCIPKGEPIRLMDHMSRHIASIGYRLEYRDLDTGAGRLCQTGRCLVCEKRLCYGVSIFKPDRRDILLEAVYKHMRAFWALTGGQTPGGIPDFRALFLLLFRPEDRARAEQWLDGQMKKEETGNA